MQISVEKNERWKFNRSSILYLEIYTGDKRTTEDFTPILLKNISRNLKYDTTII